MIVVRFVTERVHLVGRCREQQRADLSVVVFVFEEVLRQLLTLCPRVQQISEALKLIQNHEVGLESIQTGAGEDSTKLRDERASCCSRASRSKRCADPITHLFKLTMQRGAWTTDSRAESPHDARVDVPFRDPRLVFAKPSNGAEIATEDLTRAATEPAPRLRQHSKEDDPFLNHPFRPGSSGLWATLIGVGDDSSSPTAGASGALGSSAGGRGLDSLGMV